MLLYGALFNPHSNYMESLSLHCPSTALLCTEGACILQLQFLASPVHKFLAGFEHWEALVEVQGRVDKEVIFLACFSALGCIFCMAPAPMGLTDDSSSFHLMDPPLGSNKHSLLLGPSSNGQVDLSALVHPWISPLSDLWLIVSSTCITSSYVKLPLLKIIEVIFFIQVLTARFQYNYTCFACFQYMRKLKTIQATCHNIKPLITNLLIRLCPSKFMYTSSIISL